MTGRKGIGDRDSAVIAAYEKEFENAGHILEVPYEEFRDAADVKRKLFVAYTTDDFPNVRKSLHQTGTAESGLERQHLNARWIAVAAASDALLGEAAPASAGSWAGLQALARAMRKGGGNTSESQPAPQLDPDWSDLVDDEHQARFAQDVHYLMYRLELLVTRRQAKIWMESFNRDLMARPIDVVAQRSAAEVLYAIEAFEQVHYG